MLVYIEGGPEIFANKVFHAAEGSPEEDILHHPEYIARQNEYRWTPRTITSSKDASLVAQVWQHISVPEGGGPGTSPVPTAAENPNATASDSTTREVDTEATTVVSSPPVAAAVAVSPTSASSDEDSPETGDHVGETPTVEDATGLLDGEQLFLLRKRQKLTVKEVSDATGLATSKISAIEKGTGKRIKPAEVRALQDYLSPQSAQPETAEGGGEDAPRD
jgi:hypothetical protein